MNERKGTPWTREPLTAEQQDLAQKWLPFAMKWAIGRAKLYPFNEDDYKSEAQLALVLAAQNHDASKAGFGKYLSWHLRHAGKVLAQKRVPKGYRITGCLRFNPEALARVIPAIIATDDNAVLDIKTSSPALQLVDDADEVDRLLEGLTAMERDAVRGWTTLSDFAAKHGITTDFARQKRALAWRKLRDAAACARAE